jgi:hypothetical protein
MAWRTEFDPETHQGTRFDIVKSLSDITLKEN